MVVPTKEDSVGAWRELDAVLAVGRHWKGGADAEDGRDVWDEGKWIEGESKARADRGTKAVKLCLFPS